MDFLMEMTHCNCCYLLTFLDWVNAIAVVFDEVFEHVDDVDEESDVNDAGGKYCACCTKLKASFGSFEGSSNMLVFAEIFESFRNASEV